MKISRKFHKMVLTELVITCICLSSPLLVSASTTTHSSTSNIQYLDNTTSTASCLVTLKNGMFYDVKIPKSISIANETNSTTYSILVDGNIETSEVIKVYPQSSTITLSSTNKDSIEATIDQPVTEWTESDMGIAVTGEIKTPGISAGKWVGTFNFIVEKVEKVTTSN